MSAEETTYERASILLVDDMEDNLIALEAVLGSLNEPLVRARSGEEAMKALLRQRFAVVLLDIRMPGMDGFETAANIKRLDQTKDVPIIFLTGTDADAGYAFRGYATGAADYLTKPFDPWVLRAKVTVFLDLHRKNQQLERLLTQEHTHAAQISTRLAALEKRLSSEDPRTFPTYGGRSKNCRAWWQGWAATAPFRGAGPRHTRLRRVGATRPHTPAADNEQPHASREPAYISSINALYSRSTTGRFNFRLGVISPCSTSRSRGSNRNFLMVCHRWSPSLSSLTYPSTRATVAGAATTSAYDLPSSPFSFAHSRMDGSSRAMRAVQKFRSAPCTRMLET